jgi:homoprotocatechuate degradation regulator HpaR
MNYWWRANHYFGYHKSPIIVTETTKDMSITLEILPILLQKAKESSFAQVRDTLAGFGLTEQQWRVIRAAHEHGEMNAQQLAQRSAILGPSLSRILNRLESDGVLSRKTAEGDLRELTIKLSANGKRLHNKVQPTLTKHYDHLAEKLGERKSKQLMELLEYVAGLDTLH